jgi:hypothetical protein
MFLLDERKLGDNVLIGWKARENSNVFQIIMVNETITVLINHIKGFFELLDLI